MAAHEDATCVNRECPFWGEGHTDTCLFSVDSSTWHCQGDCTSGYLAEPERA